MGDLKARLDLMVLDYLLSKRGLSTDWALKFGELLPPGTVEGLSGAPQARLMLRLLVDPQNITGDTITCLGMLAQVDRNRNAVDGPHVNVAPDPELVRQVKTELVVQACKSGQATPENIKQTIDHIFKDASDSEMRMQLLAAFETPNGTASLMSQDNHEALLHAVGQYAMQATESLGPTSLERYVERGMIALAIDHAQTGQASVGKKRGRPASTKQLRVMGTDPSAAAHAIASDLQHQHHGAPSMPRPSFVADVQAAAAEPGSGGMMDGGEIGRGRIITWDAQQAGGDPALSTALVHAPHMIIPGGIPGGVGPLALPGGQVLHVRQMGAADMEGLGADGKTRRKVGRWREEETNELINLTRIHGRGKWKLILEKGAGLFANRTQVDLKDKWRNLVRQGAVNPDLFPSPEGRSKPRASTDSEPEDGRVLALEHTSAGVAVPQAVHAEAAEVPSVEAVMQNGPAGVHAEPDRAQQHGAVQPQSPHAGMAPMHMMPPMSSPEAMRYAIVPSSGMAQLPVSTNGPVMEASGAPPPQVPHSEGMIYTQPA
ncbi:hypothetical protein WJX73_003207 [Symbiochloris irregularis]|uniref:Uncharacterized protein n=1 Tax=Symbiochloris irregularis TaxID=706552 RepID=A0AAW1NT06_9CHLO